MLALIRWIRNRVDLADADSSSMTKQWRDGKDACLTLVEPFPEDSGEYQCVAENAAGSARCVIDLRLIGENL